MNVAEKTVSEKGFRREGGRAPRAPQEAAHGPRMESKGFSTSFTVNQSPREVFDAINNVRGWWSGEIEGSTDELGAVFTYRYKGLHRSTQKITELVSGKRVVWHVSDASLEFVQDKTEWNGTDIVFEIVRKGNETEVRFNHVGLVPRLQCHGNCSGAWGFYINDCLRSLITTGKNDTNPRESRERDGRDDASGRIQA